MLNDATGPTRPHGELCCHGPGGTLVPGSRFRRPSAERPAWRVGASSPIQLLILVLACLLWPVTAMAQKRVALVIGNAAYADMPLRNPVNDAIDLSAKLRQLGFEVTTLTDLDRPRMTQAIRQFGLTAQGAEAALFYFAGHGVQVRGRNHLLPIGQRFETETDVETDAVDVNAVLARVEEAGARVSLLILDACRTNPLVRSGRTAARGLARMEAPSGALIAFAAQPGAEALDGTGRNGTYTKHLLAHIDTPGLPLPQLFQRVRADVERETSRRQSPREETSLTGDFFFRPAQQSVALAPPVATAPPPATGAAVSLADLEREQQARQAWAQWQQRMQADFDRIVGFQGAADLRVQAWQRFLEAWKDDNPTSEDDDRLRAQARQALGQAEAQRQQRVAAANVPAAAGGATGGAVVGAGQTFKDCTECPDMVVIPGGRFLMGSPASETDRSASEGPQRWVDVPRFAMGKFEVTQRQWEAVMGSNPSRFRNCGPDCPVENVSWNDAQEYVRRLSQRTGQNYRLPSEAEWEYAARAGTTTAYHWGDAFDAGRLNRGGGPIASAASAQTPLVCTTCTATSGNGYRTYGTTTTLAHRTTARLG
jgi:uncharacterized caspase-like protein